MFQVVLLLIRVHSVWNSSKLQNLTVSGALQRQGQHEKALPFRNSQIFPLNINIIIAELQQTKRAIKAPWVRKIGNLSSRENLVMTSPYERPSSVQTFEEGEGRLNLTCDFECSQLIRFIYLLRSLSHSTWN